ncbi:hypothetical protein DFH09DRAFT_1141091 [Mycena vulgaris]|nr:hypothetical protein DFH09DRAFT_1141091 [Mycena vulgaris]
MVKKTVRLDADERAICRVRYNELAKTMDVGISSSFTGSPRACLTHCVRPGSSRSTNEICKAIAAHWKDGGSLETGSEYSPLLFPFGNQKAVHRHIKEAHVDAADRVIAGKWVKKQPAASQSQIRELLGLDGASEGEEGDSESDETVDSESEEDTPPVRSSKRKARKTSPVESKPAAKRRRKGGVIKTEEDVKSEEE